MAEMVRDLIGGFFAALGETASRAKLLSEGETDGGSRVCIYASKFLVRSFVLRALCFGVRQIVVRSRRLTIKSRRPCTMRNPAQALLDTRC